MVMDKHLSKHQLAGLLKKMLPSMTDEELELLVTAGVEENGASDVVSFQRFYDWMVAGHPSAEPLLGVSRKDAEKPISRSGFASCNTRQLVDASPFIGSIPGWNGMSGSIPHAIRPEHPRFGLPDEIIEFTRQCSGHGLEAIQDTVDSGKNLAKLVAEAARDVLPNRIILLRHGESEGNIDRHVYRNKADNMIELTDLGSKQAENAGRRIKELIGDDRVHMFVSPFQRTLQTARNILGTLNDQVGLIEKDPRIREQEFGNLQGDDFSTYREEQKVVGRYFYRFPTGESGRDVYVRVKDWWDNSLLQLNLRPKYAHVDTVVVVTHGLTMRLILMQLFMWSSNTFHTVFNADNCEMYVLQKDDSLPGHSPYALDPTQGDMPNSSIELVVEFKSGEQRKLKLKDYLSLPMPRTNQQPLVRKMLAAQHNLDPEDIVEVDFYGGKYTKFK